MRTTAKKLANDVSELEKTSSRYIATTNYYVVLCSFVKKSAPQHMIEMCKTFLLSPPLEREDYIPPLCGYVYDSMMYLLFSSTEGSHYFEGNHQLITSCFASAISKRIPELTLIRIIEFDARPKVIAYFHTKIFENTMTSMRLLSSDEVRKKDTESLTMAECISLFEERTKTKWSQVPAADRHGVFFKYTNNTFVTLSEMWDLQKIEKYFDYIFGF